LREVLREPLVDKGVVKAVEVKREENRKLRAEVKRLREDLRGVLG
jgi:hypothetical protein